MEDIVERLGKRIDKLEDSIEALLLMKEAAKKIETMRGDLDRTATIAIDNARETLRIRNLLRNPTPEMLEVGRVANRMAAGNPLGLNYLAPDAAWQAMANVLLKENV